MAEGASPKSRRVGEDCLAPRVGNSSAIAGDMLHGADEIAVFLFGDQKQRRRVYNLVNRNGLPVFRIGVNICARKQVLLDWIATQERRSVGGT